MQVFAYVALGSNLSNPLLQVTEALQELNLIEGCQVTAQSRWYRSSPLGPAEQPDFINGVAQLSTGLEPLALLDQLQAIEQRHHRLRLQHWGPRTLDLDLILYGDRVIHDPRLTVPHAEMKERDFVLQPLSDICPDLTLPDGSNIRQLLQVCPRNNLVPLSATEGQPCD